MVSLLPTPEQTQIIQAVSAFLESELPVARLHDDDPGRAERVKWQSMADLGWFGLGLSEEVGGAGFDFADRVLAFRVFGHHLLSPCVLATSLACGLAAEAGDLALKDRLLGGLERAAAGQARAGATLGETSSGPFHLMDADAAEWIVLWNDDGIGMFAREAFVISEPLQGLDWTLPLRRGKLDKARAAAWLRAGKSSLSRQATFLVAAMLVGIAEATRDRAVAYAKIREQFGRPIGAFQAVKHRCADMAVLAESAWAQTIYAALAEQAGLPDAGFSMRAARILAADAAIRNAESAIQVHGGIGFTADADLHLFVKRAHVLNQLGGDIRKHQAMLLEIPRPSHAAVAS